MAGSKSPHCLVLHASSLLSLLYLDTSGRQSFTPQDIFTWPLAIADPDSAGKSSAMTVQGLHQYCKKRGLFETMPLELAGKKGHLRRVFADLGSYAYKLRAAGLSPVGQVKCVMNIVRLIHRHDPGCDPPVLTLDCVRNPRAELACEMAGMERGSGLLYVSASDNIAAACQAVGCEKVIFVRAFAGEAESQAVGLALMRHKRTDQPVTVMGIDSDIPLMGLPAEAVFCSYLRFGEVKILAVGKLAAELNADACMLCRLHPLLRTDLPPVLSGLGLTRMEQVLEGLKANGKELEKFERGELLRLALATFPKVKMLEDGESHAHDKEVNYRCANFLDITDGVYSIQSLSRFNGMKATSEELEKAGITKVTAAPAFLKEIAIMGTRSPVAPYAPRIPSVDAEVAEVCASGQLEAFVADDESVRKLTSLTKRVEEVKEAMRACKENGEKIVLDGPRATWRKKLVHLTKAQIHHVLWRDMERAELLELLTELGVTTTAMRSEVTAACYYELDNELLPAYMELYNLQEGMEFRFAGRIKREIYKCWPKMSELAVERGLPHLGPKSAEQLQTLFGHWDQQKGGKKRRDYWQRKAVKDREDAGMDYLRGNKKRYPTTGNKYTQFAALCIEYVEVHPVIGPCCKLKKLDGSLNKLALLAGSTRDAVVRQCFNEMVRNWIAPDPLRYPLLNDQTAKQLRGMFTEMTKAKHAQHGEYEKIEEARERTRRAA